ncbi:MAG: phosphoesterase [Planctomycetes bacterium]|nr:phosphoesterase [Planctomycetota bacterium]
MRLALISDLHSNLEALTAVLTHIEDLGISDIGCLGDVVGYGPDPVACVDLVRQEARFCLLGNHDEALVMGAQDFNPHAREAVDWTRRCLKPRWYHGPGHRSRWSWLTGLKPEYEEGGFYFYHASPRDPVREYVLSTDAMLNRQKLEGIFAVLKGTCFVGHTHYPGVFDSKLRWTGLEGETSLRFQFGEDGPYIFNVGSVGQPRDGDNRACYLVLEDDAVTWYRVPYDYRSTMAKINATGVLGDMLARRLAVGH